jgi:signal peptide peptidase SppA
MTNPSRAINFILGQAWLIEPSWLPKILDIANRVGDPEALATQLGRPLDNTQTVDHRPGGIAVVPITGPIFRYANLFTNISGATSTQVLATDIRAALDDPSVRSIVLEIDSPGGEAAGINELAQMIYDARALKPIKAYISGVGASAAYWIASAASQIIVDPTSLLGSIGVVMSVTDTVDRDAKAGVRNIDIVSSQSPNKRPDLRSDSGRAQMQTLVDSMAAVFIQSIARNRGVTPNTVANKFGKGGMLVGAEAVRAGMADGLGSLEGLIAGKMLQKPSAISMSSPAVDNWSAIVARHNANELKAAAQQHGNQPTAPAMTTQAPKLTGSWARVVERLKAKGA